MSIMQTAKSAMGGRYKTKGKKGKEAKITYDLDDYH